MAKVFAALGRYSRTATGVVTALLSVAIVALFVTGADVKIPDKLFAALTALMVPTFVWWLKQGQRETQKKVDDIPQKIISNGKELLDLAEARGFTRGSTVAARTLLESLPIPYVEISASTMAITRFNSHLLDLTGYTRAELLGEPIQILVPEQYRTPHADMLRRFIDNPSIRPMGVSRALQLRRKDGTSVPVEIMLGTFAGLTEMVVVAVIWQRQGGR